MNQKATDAPVQEIMLEFAHLTGLAANDAHSRRYLWTDAFAVCNYFELFDKTKEEKYRSLGLRLIDQVHQNLGRHRVDDSRRGWISGLDEQEGRLHPTIGGLRIGKPKNERKPNEPLDERLQWDQDGQYYHYLTKWMHALSCASHATGNPNYIRWAIELAKAAYAGFTYASAYGGRKRMYWKMSIDLTYPLVSSMGQHDPLDGFVTYCELKANASDFLQDSSIFDLKTEISGLAEICRGVRLVTDDPLGIGGLLFDASRIVQLMIKGAIGNTGDDLLENVLKSSLIGVKAFAQSGSLEYPADYRLAFRELGLSIGFSAIEKLHKAIEGNSEAFSRKSLLQPLVDDLMEFLPLGKAIEDFWLDRKNRESETWIEHREINMVMLATSLAPEGFLTI
jgi:hypothetical protein